MNLQRGTTRLRQFVFHDSGTAVGFFIVATFVIMSVVESIGGYSILPDDPLGISPNSAFQAPTLSHPLGTNNLGTDVLSMIIAGAPNDAMVSFFVVGVAALFGGLLGAFAGYLGGWLDEGLMRTADIFFAIPSIILGLSIAIVLGPSPVNVMLALSVVWWPFYARLVRSEALKLATMNYVESAKLSGLGTARIVFRHIYRVALPTIIVYATLDVGTVVLAYSGLAYLGLAVRPPYPDWGFMVAQSQQFMFRDPLLALIPGIVIVIIAAGFALLGDGLREALQREVSR